MFDKTSFKLIIGFLLIIFVSFLVFIAIGYYRQVTEPSSAAVIMS